MIAIPEVHNEVRRNQKCPCGSGLKFKKCHGSPTIQQEVKQMAVMMVFKRITEARGRAGIISQEECERLVSQVDTRMIEMITGEVDEPPAPEPAVEVKDVAELQKDLDRCPKCGQVTFGKECIKCKEKLSGKTVA